MNCYYCSIFNKYKERDKLPQDYAWTFKDLAKNIPWRSDTKFSVKDLKINVKNISSISNWPSVNTPLLLKKTIKVMAPIIWRQCWTQRRYQNYQSQQNNGNTFQPRQNRFQQNVSFDNSFSQSIEFKQQCTRQRCLQNRLYHSRDQCPFNRDF